MIVIKSKTDCVGCFACYNICPSKCITMEQDSEGFVYPQVNNKGCIKCGLCIKSCPMNSVLPQENFTKTYAAWSKNNELRENSSSGGIFSVLMESFISKGGIIFGAAFNDNMILQHGYADSEMEYIKFRGSKYLQSIIGNTYKEAKKFLEEDKYVLFSGTPCQIAGLHTYLNEKYDKLFTCDIVCHGVPSQEVFKRYLNMMKKKYGAGIKSVNFRCKDYGWRKYLLHLAFDNNVDYKNRISTDLFMYGFLRNIFLRPSCHKCRFSRLPRIADISLGDFWGLRSHHPEWDDDKGTSLVIVNTKKGAKMLDDCVNKIYLYDAPIEKAIAGNPCICGSVSANKCRDAFFRDFNEVPFEKVMKKYCKDSMIKRLYKLFLKIVYKMKRVSCFQ